MALDLAHRLLAYRFNMSYVPVPVVPEFIDMLKVLYTREEAWIAALMPPAFASAKTIAKLRRKDAGVVDKTLQEMLKKRLLMEYTDRGVQKFSLPPFVPGVAEFQLMTGEITPELVEFTRKFHDAFNAKQNVFLEKLSEMGSSFGRVIPVNESVSSTQHVLAYEDARSIIKDARSFSISHCYCRMAKDVLNEKSCKAPRDICMSFDFAAEFLIRNKIGKEVDCDTMLRKLDLAEKHNLVHVTDNAQSGFSFMCHCCGCCCGFLTSLNVYNLKPPLVMSSWIIEWDVDKCDHCGKCSRACQLGALSWVNKNTLYNEERCIGCGVCVSVCPNGALRLVPRKEWEEPSPTYGDMVMDMMANRLRSGLKLPVKKLPGHKYMARMTNEILRLDKE
jgi:NAD-dependent dihydropyrimidine dehydrogenase PreA subunit